MRTIREFFDTTNAGGVQGFQRLVEMSGGPRAEDNYDIEGSTVSDPGSSPARPRKGWGRKWERAGFAADILSDPGGAIMDTALGFAGRALSRGAKKIVSEQVLPAMQATVSRGQAATVEEQFAQAQADQDAIVARYPELRTCVTDQVVYLDGGSLTVPVSEIPVTVTLAQADAVVARLR